MTGRLCCSLLTNERQGRSVANRLKWGLTAIASMLVCNPEEEIGREGCIYDSLVLSLDSWLLQLLQS